MEERDDSARDERSRMLILFSTSVSSTRLSLLSSKHMDSSFYSSMNWVNGRSSGFCRWVGGGS